MRYVLVLKFNLRVLERLPHPVGCGIVRKLCVDEITDEVGEALLHNRSMHGGAEPHLVSQVVNREQLRRPRLLRGDGVQLRARVVFTRQTIAGVIDRSVIVLQRRALQSDHALGNESSSKARLRDGYTQSYISAPSAVHNTKSKGYPTPIT